MKKKIEFVSPFSNGTEAMFWLSDNCELCSRAYNLQPGEDPPDIEETKALIEKGEECKLKAYIDLGFITNKIPLFIAKEIGYKNSALESCRKFTDELLPVQASHNVNQLTLFDLINDAKSRAYEQ